MALDDTKIEAAREVVRKALHAADNANQAGEDAVVAMAASGALLDVCKRHLAWLELLAARSEASAKDRTFITLAEAHIADAKNFRATAKPLRAAIALAEGAA